MRPHFGGFSWRYLVEEKWEQLGGETASSTLGWRERYRSVLSEDESAVISLSLSLSPCFSRRVSPCYTSSSRFLSPLCLSISLRFESFTITSSSSSSSMTEPNHCTHLLTAHPASISNSRKSRFQITFKDPENLFSQAASSYERWIFFFAKVLVVLLISHESSVFVFLSVCHTHTVLMKQITGGFHCCLFSHEYFTLQRHT